MLKRLNLQALAVDGLFLVGVVLVAGGLGMVYLPLAPIIGGLALVGCAVVLR